MDSIVKTMLLNVINLHCYNPSSYEYYVNITVSVATVFISII